jgi:tRNA uridine 5-carboxymethylaminomethyl modification enzyme
LSALGHEIGLLPQRNYAKFRAKEAAIQAEIQRLETTRTGQETLAQKLRRPEINYTDIVDNVNLSKEIVQQVEIAVKYAGYIARQENEVCKFKDLEDKQIPMAFDYAGVPSLRLEARQKLSKIRPGTIGQASRISGVSPADISILLVWLKRTSQPKETENSSASSEEPMAGCEG